MLLSLLVATTTTVGTATAAAAMDAVIAIVADMVKDVVMSCTTCTLSSPTFNFGSAVRGRSPVGHD